MVDNGYNLSTEINLFNEVFQSLPLKIIVILIKRLGLSAKNNRVKLF
jgi:hypothetical protein